MFKRFSTLRLIVCCLCMQAFCLNTAAADQQVASSVIKLATVSDLAPYAYRSEDNAWQGIDFDIVQLVFERVGIQFDVYSFPRARVGLMLKSGRLDGILTTSGYNDEAILSQMWLSDTLYDSDVSLFSLKTHALMKQSFDVDDLLVSNYRLGLHRAYSYEIPAGLDKARQISVHYDQQLVDLLEIGRIDMAIAEDISFVYSARMSGKFDMLAVVAEVSNQPIKMVLAKSVVAEDPDLPDKINQAISALRDEGKVDLIILKHLSLQDDSL